MGSQKLDKFFENKLLKNWNNQKLSLTKIVVLLLDQKAVKIRFS